MAGQGPQLRYMQTSRVDSKSGAAPSLGLAVQLAAGAAAAKAVKVLLGRGPRRPLPWLFHFDAYAHHFRRYYRPLAARDPLFRCGCGSSGGCSPTSANAGSVAWAGADGVELR